MVAGSILPFTIHQGKVYFLFGKENALADTPGFSDFGGGVENKETPYDTALREGAEELTGFLGDSIQIKKHIGKNGGVYKIVNGTYHSHVIYVDYDENLCKYYNQNHSFLWNRMDQKMLNDSCLFEKIEIKWFSIRDMKKHKKQFRDFYQQIVDQIVSEVPAILKHFGKKLVSSTRGSRNSRKVGKNKTMKKGKYEKRNEKNKRGG